MYNVPGARLSPEIVAGVLRFCYGDTFSVYFNLNLRDQDGTPVDIGKNDHVVFEVFDRSHQSVTRISLVNVSNNTIRWDVNGVISGRMVPGEYTYRISVEHGGNRTTVALENKILVR